MQNSPRGTGRWLLHSTCHWTPHSTICRNRLHTSCTFNAVSYMNSIKHFFLCPEYDCHFLHKWFLDGNKSQTVSVNTILYLHLWLNGNCSLMSSTICLSGYFVFVLGWNRAQWCHHQALFAWEGSNLWWVSLCNHSVFTNRPVRRLLVLCSQV